jgi:hypothetical protein
MVLLTVGSTSPFYMFYVSSTIIFADLLTNHVVKTTLYIVCAANTAAPNLIKILTLLPFFILAFDQIATIVLVELISQIFYICHIPDPPYFSLVTTFNCLRVKRKVCVYLMDGVKKLRDEILMLRHL